MRRYLQTIILAGVIALAASCSDDRDGLTKELDQLVVTRVTLQEFQARIGLTPVLSEGTIMNGSEATRWIKNFCADANRERGMDLLHSCGETLFFTSPNLTLFTFFDEEDIFVGYVIGSQ